MSSRKCKMKCPGERGFTITELLVSIGVMVIISGVLVTRYSSFNSAVLLKSQAYEVALLIREAQLYAVASQGEADDFTQSYGVYFNKNNPQTYLLFRDDSGNGRYGSGDTVLVSTRLDDRFEIRGFEDADDGAGGPVGGSELSILFTRPNFDARFADGSGTLSEGVVYIEVVTAGGTGNENDTLRTVEISSAGQITVQ